jgi:type VI protein secretion system component Hcp
MIIGLCKRLALGALGVAGFCASASATKLEMTAPEVEATPFPIDSFSFTLHAPGHGSSSVSDFTITRPVDSTTTLLFKAGHDATLLPTATVQICWPSCLAPAKEETLTFTDAIVASDETLGSGKFPYEQLTFAFESVTVSFTGDGSPNDELRQLHPWTTLLPPNAPTGPGAPTDLVVTETLDALDLQSSDQTAPGILGESLPDTLAGTISVPEPATLSLTGLGLAAVGFMRRRRAH